MSIGFKSVVHHGHKSQQMADRIGGSVNNPYPIGSQARVDFSHGVNRCLIGAPWQEPKSVKQVHERY